MKSAFLALIAAIIAGYCLPTSVSASSTEHGMMCTLAAATSTAMSCMNACAPIGKSTLCKLSKPPVATEKACQAAMAKRDAKACYLACTAKSKHPMCMRPNSCPMMRSTM